MHPSRYEKKQIEKEYGTRAMNYMMLFKEWVDRSHNAQHIIINQIHRAI